MPSHITYNGITRYAAGGLTKIIADALAPVQGGTDGIVALIGEADGGIPGQLMAIDDSSVVGVLVKSGPLADAVNIAFKPSSDPLIPGGASRVYLYKTNNSTQSAITLPSDPAESLVSSIVTGGTGSTLVDSSLVGNTSDGEFAGAWIVLRAHTATQEIKPVTTYVAATGTFSVGSAWSSNPTAADEYMILSNTVVTVGEVSSGASTTTIPVLGATFVVDDHAGRWVVLHNALGAPIYRKVASNTSSTLTVTPSLPAAPAAGLSWVEILANSVVLTSRDYGEHTNGISVDIATDVSGAKIATVSFENQDQISGGIGNYPFFKLLFKGAPVLLTDTVAVTSTATVINLVTGGLTPSAHVGQQVLIDGEYTVITANTASQLTVSPALSAVPATGELVEIHGITLATCVINGAEGVATGLTTSTGVVGADLNLTFSPSMTLRQLLATINTNPNYTAVVPNGLNQDTLLAKDFDFGPATKFSILTSPGLTSAGATQNVMQLVNYFNQVSTLVTASRANDGALGGAATAGDIAAPIPLSGGTRGISTNASFQAGFDQLLQVRVNHVVPLIDRDLVNEGYGSTAAIKSVAAQLKDHLIAARGAVGSERGGYLGFHGTKAQIIAQANNLNDIDIALCPQGVVRLNLSGTLTSFGPRMQAVIAAGSRAGVTEVGEPLTFKQLNTAGLTNDGSWAESDLTDSNDLIKAGILFAVTDDNNVSKWARDLTTWVTDDNLAYSEGSVRSVVRFVAYNLRKTLVDRYCGRKAAPRTIRNVKNTAVTLLEQYRTNSIIVDSTDPTSGATVKAYNSMVVTSVGDTVKLCVSVFPVPGINFMLNEISLGLATQVA